MTTRVKPLYRKKKKKGEKGKNLRPPTRTLSLPLSLPLSSSSSLKENEERQTNWTVGALRPPTRTHKNGSSK